MRREPNALLPQTGIPPDTILTAETSPFSLLCFPCSVSPVLFHCPESKTTGGYISANLLSKSSFSSAFPIAI